MNLADMTTLVCLKVGQTDPASQTAAGRFINRRYQTIYDSENWLDSLGTGDTSTLPGSADVLIPFPVDRPISVQYDNQWLEKVDVPFLMETAPELLLASNPGTPKYYTEITLNAARYLRLYPTPDASKKLVVWGKRIFYYLINPGDTPVLRNSDNCLIAFATSDMLQRQHSYAKAKELIEEAGAALDQMRAIETQRSNLPRRSKNVTMNGDSLSEMMDAVSMRIKDYTADSKILIKDFLRRNYVDVYDSMLWPETTIIAEVNRDGSEIILPEYIDRVVSVRQNVNMGELVPTEGNLLFGINPQIFEQSGSPVAYQMLTSVAVAVLPPFNEPLRFTISNSEDEGKSILIRGESQGVELIETLILSITPALSNWPYDTPITIAKPLTKGGILIEGHESGTYLGTLYPLDRETRYMRLWLQPTPTDQDGNKALILGKRRCNPLVTDEDTPILRGIGNILINMTAADMFTVSGNKELAAAMSAKAQGALEILKHKETQQNAFSQRILPYVDSMAYGDEAWGCGSWSKVTV